MKISEASIHIESIRQLDAIFAMQWPQYIVNGSAPFHHSAGGEIRNIRTATKLKRMGTRKGYPDLVCHIPNKNHNGIAMELKRPKTVSQQKGYLSKEQKEWRNHIEICGGLFVVCYSVQEIIDTVLKYMEDV